MIEYLWIAGSATLIGALVARHANRPQGRRGVVILQIALAGLALLYLLVPWRPLYLAALSDQDRDAAARRVFGKTYAAAKQVLERCEPFHARIAGLETFRISLRPGRAEDLGAYTRGFYDFDYAGGAGKGRATVLLVHHREIAAGDAEFPPQREAFDSGRARYGDQGLEAELEPLTLVVYPGYDEEGELVVCEGLVVQPEGGG